MAQGRAEGERASATEPKAASEESPKNAYIRQNISVKPNAFSDDFRRCVSRCAAKSGFSGTKKESARRKPDFRSRRAHRSKLCRVRRGLSNGFAAARRF